MSREATTAKLAREASQLPAERLSLLPSYAQALEMIERAAHVDEAKAIRDKAAAFQAYASKPATARWSSTPPKSGCARSVRLDSS